MPNDDTPPLVSMAQQFTGLPMGDLIGAPLLAAAQANSMMAATQTKFLLDTAFSVSGEGDKQTYKPVIITMELTRSALVAGEPGKSDPKILPVTTTFELPLLTIIPLNSLAVDDVDVSFNMEVKSSYSEATNNSTQESLAAASSFSTKFGFGVFSATVQGNVSYDKKTSSSRDTHYEKSNSAQYTVKVHAGQLPLPQGVNTIIQAFTNAITPITMPTAGKQGN
ncbi:MULTISPECIES: DUF2589 domain-containing protein [Polyangium]|uniref:DUF2589 domain-containing protein n=2 Tax=Polyangium TaxID=55 RepID=A0A4U1JF53_9BACT|nr:MULTISPECIES: DUF2589 domain-containing protein [Polyangium]MDI1430030.1 DUF2589 domain-containing protein [Polyangium sorediatum]TKD09807.1 DUF2589 domain-containing protein [Polyangium fumosum]